MVVHIITVWYVMQESDMGRSCGTHVRMRNAYKDLYRKPERRRQLGRHVCTWKDAIKANFKEVIWGGFGLGLFGSGNRAMMGMCEHSNEP
jgi:hypothetical protein